jgi:hypothetical protein
MTLTRWVIMSMLFMSTAAFEHERACRHPHQLFRSDSYRPGRPLRGSTEWWIPPCALA